jgi:dTDP-4-dehydrorhamnose reductase
VSVVPDTILVTGARGQLGAELAPALAPLGRVVAVDRALLDLADADALVRVVREIAPAWIVNAAAYTAVDRAETERDTAFAINARAPGILAEEAKRLGAILVHYSTDYVFDGTRDVPYDETCAPNPLNVYGASKLAGEQAVAASGAAALTLRTSWVYGLRGSNFLLTIRRLAAERNVLRIVDDQVGTPNWTRALAEATASIVAQGRAEVAERAGLYHMSAAGQTSWHGFARAIIGDVPRPDVVPIASADYPTPALRPAYGVLATSRLRESFGIVLPEWRALLHRCLASGAEPPAPNPVA